MNSDDKLHAIIGVALLATVAIAISEGVYNKTVVETEAIKAGLVQKLISKTVIWTKPDDKE